MHHIMVRGRRLKGELLGKGIKSPQSSAHCECCCPRLSLGMQLLFIGDVQPAPGNSSLSSSSMTTLIVIREWGISHIFKGVIQFRF